jgi:hypothetical protein
MRLYETVRYHSSNCQGAVPVAFALITALMDIFSNPNDLYFLFMAGVICCAFSEMIFVTEM